MLLANYGTFISTRDLHPGIQKADQPVYLKN